MEDMSPAEVRDALRSVSALRRFRARTQFSREGYLQIAFQHAQAAGKYGRIYSKLVEDAFAYYGERGPMISGVMQEHFPGYVKEELRATLDRYNEESQLAQLYYKASGLRTPFRDTELAQLVGNAAGYGFQLQGRSLRSFESLRRRR